MLPAPRAMRVTRSRIAILAVASIAFVAGYALGHASTPPPEWREAGSLAAPRSHLNALVLASEDILVFGGLDPDRPGVVLPGAELVDPWSGRTRSVEGELTPRIDASASTLRSGLVVVVGGSAWTGDDWTQVATTEILDPWTKEWRAARSLRDARADHGATVLADGRVMVAGGHRGIRMLSSVEIFDPRTETWTTARPLPGPRQQFSMATLPNGEVLVAGGLEAGGAPSHTSLLYDPATDRWRPGPGLTTDRVLQATATLANGDVLLVGGQKAAAGTAERYEVSSDRFVDAGSLAHPRMVPQVARLADGRVVAAGGLEPLAGEFLPASTVELYDPATNAWAPGPSLDEASAFGGFVAVEDEAWLIAGAVEGERPIARIMHVRLR